MKILGSLIAATSFAHDGTQTDILDGDILLTKCDVSTHGTEISRFEDMEKLTILIMTIIPRQFD